MPEDKIHKSAELDDFVSAEIPDDDDAFLRELVIKWMIHISHELAIYRKDDSGHLITRDSRNAAPFNAYFFKKYNCRINVEKVGSILAVKYLYNYIYKGHNCASIRVVNVKS